MIGRNETIAQRSRNGAPSPAIADAAAPVTNATLYASDSAASTSTSSIPPQWQDSEASTDAFTILQDTNKSIEEVTAALDMLMPPPLLSPQQELDAIIDDIIVIHRPRAKRNLNINPSPVDDRPLSMRGHAIKLAWKYIIIAYIFTAASAFTASASDGLSLKKAGNKSLILLTIAIITAFLSSFELSGRSAGVNIREIIKLLFKGEWPEELLDEHNNPPNFSTKKKVLLSTLVLGVAAWCVVSEAIQAFQFIQTFGSDYEIDETKIAKHLWMIFAITIACGSALTRLFTDNVEFAHIVAQAADFKNTLQKFRADETPTPIKVAAIGTGGTFATVKAVHDAVQAYWIMKLSFDLQSLNARLALATACSTETFAGLAFFGKAMIEQLLDLGRFSVDVYHKKRTFELPKIAATVVSLALAIFLADLKRILNRSFYEGLVSSDLIFLDGKVTSPMFDGLSWLIAGSEVMITVTSLNPQFMSSFTKMADKLSRAITACKKPNLNGEYPIAENLTPDVENGLLPKHSIFAQPSAASAALRPAPTENSPLLSYASPTVHY